MTVIQISLATAGILGFIYLVLTVNVMRQRIKTKVMIGDGRDKTGDDTLLIAIRAHANFAEYVPLALILLGGIEAAGASRILCLILAAMLILGRILHPLGLTRSAPNAFRGGGAVLTWAMIGVASLEALFLSL